MATITLPSIGARNVQMRLVRGDQWLEFFGGAGVAIQSTKALWAMSFQLKPYRQSDARAWQAALVQLAKLGNTFQITPPAWQRGTSYAGATPLVAGASQLGLSLNCDGVTASTLIGKAGDYIEIPTTPPEMKMLTADATSDGFGAVTFNFEPALRTSPPDNGSLDIVTPIVVMRLVDPEAVWNIDLDDFYGMTINAIESF